MSQAGQYGELFRTVQPKYSDAGGMDWDGCLVHFILWSQNFQEPWTPWSWLKTKTTTKIRGWTKPLRTTAQADICSQAIAPFALPGALPQLLCPVLNRAKPSPSQPFCEALPCRVGRVQLCLCPRRPLVQTSLTCGWFLPACLPCHSVCSFHSSKSRA